MDDKDKEDLEKMMLWDSKLRPEDKKGDSSLTDHIRSQINAASKEMDAEVYLGAATNAIFEICAGLINEAPPGIRMMVAEAVNVALQANTYLFQDRARKRGVSVDQMDHMIRGARDLANRMDMVDQTEDNSKIRIEKSGLVDARGKPLS